MVAKPILYNGRVSSCSHRVRIALNLKGVDYEYKEVNPWTYPVSRGQISSASSLTSRSQKKALNLQIASIVCSSIQPLQSYGVTGLIKGRLSSSESLQVVEHYIDKGFRAIEKLLKGCSRRYAIGDEVQLADVFLAPQIHVGVARFQIDMSKYPILARLNEEYRQVPAFQAALPENQPDAPSS